MQSNALGNTPITVSAITMDMEKFKINPYELLNKISLLDLFTYIKLLERKISKENDSINKNDLTKSLVALRDILIFMTMGKDGLRMRN